MPTCCQRRSSSRADEPDPVQAPHRPPPDAADARHPTEAPPQRAPRAPAPAARAPTGAAARVP
ncbi:unnamed protein product [Spirodela intermedia]|uniref:Uncharacterized protein n=1 Tax=Spirodela intermedia TaxID=51605 RepID=A0A811G7J6_SPIIN|nr:unnamed protein product [Spirodela intermedia]